MKKTAVFWFLVFCLTLCCGFILTAALFYEPSVLQTVSEPGHQEATRLSAPGSRAGQASPSEIPPWLVELIALFAAGQLIPLIIASRKSRKRFPTETELREVNFLCETPMYLGLLGSLVGVCITQFLTGSLAAPLAYLTTIFGIMLYLFGKYAIALPMGHEMDRDRLSGA